MSEAFLKVVNMSISTGWLVLAVLALRLILKKAPKWVNVLLWGIVAVRLICPFSIESALSLIPSTETISPEIMMDWTPEISTGIEPLDQVVNPVISTSFAPQGMASANPLQILIPVAANLWLLGILILLAYTAISYLTLRHKLRTAVILRDNIFQCETVSSPFVLGIVKPRIYLPYAMDGKNLGHVVAHEQAHIRRKDHWWKPLGFLLLTVYWFNPLMWIAYILLCRDIELACDEKVIAELGNEQRADYTQALVACAVNRRMIAACPLAFGEVGVKDRVKSIMNYRKPAFWIIVTALVVCVVVAVCFLTDPVYNVNEDSYLNYKHSILLSRRQDVIPAVHYSGENDQGSIGIGMVEGIAFAEYLDGAKWYEKKFIPSDLSSPGSITVNLAENLRMTVYDRQFAAVKFNAEVCYYRVANDDYEKLLNILMPADEERLEKSSEARLELVLGIATMDSNVDGVSFGVYDLEGENAGITEIRIRNLHNGDYTTITDQYEIQLISDFIAQVHGENPMSSKGYYGGCYEVQMYNGSEKVFGFGFGDDESFNYGMHSDGYPMRYELRGVNREDVIRFFSRFDSSGFDWGLPSFVMRAKILEIHDGYFIVEPVEGSWELSSASKIEVPVKNMSPSPEPQVGDILNIEYDGQILETYPARINKVYHLALEQTRYYSTIMVPTDTKLHGLQAGALLLPIAGNTYRYLLTDNTGEGVTTDELIFEFTEPDLNRTINWEVYSLKEHPDLSVVMILSKEEGPWLCTYSPPGRCSDTALTDAINAGYVVMEDGAATHGQDVWKSFFEDTQKGMATSVIVAHYQTLDPERCDTAYFEAFNQDYPSLNLYHLNFDGTSYTLSFTDSGVEYIRNYEYLMKLEASGTPLVGNTEHKRIVHYALTHDIEHTWEDLWGSLASSAFPAPIDFYTIYSENVK